MGSKLESKMKLILAILPLLLANQELDDNLSNIFDNEDARNERLAALKDRISSLGGFDENYDAYYKHLTGEKLDFVLKRNKEIQEKTKILQEMMQKVMTQTLDDDDLEDSDEDDQLIDLDIDAVLNDEL